MGTGESGQALSLNGIQLTQEFAVFVTRVRGAFGHSTCQVRRFFQLHQALAPERFAHRRVLLLQPSNVLGKRRGYRRQRLALAGLQHFIEDQGITPAIHQDVVAGVDQVPVVFARADQRHPQQRRARQLEALAMVLGGQAVEGRRQIRTVAPVVFDEGQADLAMHHLQGLALVVLPDKAGAQHVMPCQHLLPGALKYCNVHSLHVGAQLADIDVILTLLVEAVEQHALLHGRQWIQVLHAPCRQCQVVQLGLGQVRQAYIGRCQAAVLRVEAMRDQRQQFLLVIVRQLLDGCSVEHLATEPPLQGQFAAIHLPFHRQPIGQRRLRVLSLTAALGRRNEQRRLVELAVELAQVVEGDARRGQAR
ncbi:hypothetical protein [Pseudomonas sp. 22 E 5]|nr:hypothetical protein [Pseudomonas sp. 22 E 5]